MCAYICDYVIHELCILINYRISGTVSSCNLQSFRCSGETERNVSLTPISQIPEFSYRPTFPYLQIEISKSCEDCKLLFGNITHLMARLS